MTTTLHTKVPMTIEGAVQLRQELEQLKRKRVETTVAIAEARAHGDLKENAEYHAAREQQSILEARIRDVEYKLAYATVIDIKKIPRQNHVIFGVTVHLSDIAKGVEVVYKLVGEDEANIDLGKISILSPLARALVGKSVGDIVEVTTPLGMTDYEIIRIEHI